MFYHTELVITFAPKTKTNFEEIKTWEGWEKSCSRLAATNTWKQPSKEIARKVRKEGRKKKSEKKRVRESLNYEHASAHD